MKHRANLFRHVRYKSTFLSCMTALAIAGCGGGGGADTSTPSVAGPTSLVPAAPTLGEVLEPDAAALASLVDGANWRFWGRLQDSVGNTVARYESSYRLTQSGTDWTLSGTNPGNEGADSIRLQFTAGQLQQIEALQFGPKQAAEEVRITLLRSPVRVGDQILAYNKRIEGFPDGDGDGKTESMDIAVYTRVIGAEKLSTAMDEQLDAVRVETHVLMRTLYSKANEFGPVEKIVGVEWFARGLGWVGRDQPSTTADGRIRMGAERLVGADLGTQGYGNPSGAKALVNPASSPEQAGQALRMPRVDQVINDGERVLLVGATPGPVTYPSRPLLSQLNSRGEVQWTRLGPAETRFAAPLGTGWVMWGNLANWEGANVYRLDAQGQPLTSGPQALDLGTPQTPLKSAHRSFQIAGDAQALWVSNIRQDWVTRADGLLGVRDGLVIRGYDLSGNPTTAPILLERTVGEQTVWRNAVSLCVHQGQAYLAWVSIDGIKASLKLARVTSTGMVNIKEAPVDAIHASTFVQVSATANGVVLNWGSPSDRYAWINANLSMQQLDATRSDASLPPWPSSSSGQGVARGSELLRWSIEADLSSGALNGTSGKSLRWQPYRPGATTPIRRTLVGESLYNYSDFFLLPMKDRLLIIRPINKDGIDYRGVEQVRY